MTISTLDSAATSRVSPSRAPQSQHRRGRIGTAVVLIVSLVFSGVLRQVAADRQAAVVNIRGAAASRSTLGNMDSFALALLLGGLRGPLVMILWPAIETQKQDHNLDDIDTMIEWVRLLQPEFDSVHMFQIWNKAYNISAMMASPANKYTVIMEALKYAESVDRERPGDINILSAVENVYSGKLGNTNLPEFPFYSRQFREESLTNANRLAAYPEDKDRYRPPDKWQPLLDENNQLRADLLAPNRPRPADVAASDEWNDGSEFQYLNQFGPFPYGVSPLGLAYNYAKRAEVAMNGKEGQKPLQSTPMVIDSQPAIQLKFWTEDEVRRGRVYEARAFGLPPPPEKNQRGDDPALSAISLTQTPVDPRAIEAAEYYYNNAFRTSEEALKEYDRHVKKPQYAIRYATTYRSHISDMQSAGWLAAADRDYLIAMKTTDPAARIRLLHDASDNYYKAMIRCQRTALEFFTEEYALWGDPKISGTRVMPANAPYRDKAAIFGLEESLIPDIYKRAMANASALPPGMQDHMTEREAYAGTVNRCRLRIEAISRELKK